MEGEEKKMKKEMMQPGSAESSLVARIIDPTTSTPGEVEASNIQVFVLPVRAVGSQPAEKAGQDHGDTGALSSAPRPSPLMHARQRAQAEREVANNSSSRFKPVFRVWTEEDGEELLAVKRNCCCGECVYLPLHRHLR